MLRGGGCGEEAEAEKKVKETEVEETGAVEDAEEEDEKDKDDDEAEGHLNEEGRKLKKARRRIRGPTAQERLDHYRTHFPYRSWCPICVVARGISQPHRAKEEEDRLMSTMASMMVTMMKHNQTLTL